MHFPSQFNLANIVKITVELSFLHETILRVDIVATNVAWESVKANFLVYSCCHFNFRTFIM